MSAPYTTLIDCPTLAAFLGQENWIVVDCRFKLEDTAAGEHAYGESHIPGAVYAHLDRDLSSQPVTDYGRHPLPSPATLTRLFGRLGIDQRKQVVAYDDADGMVASRLWWMLRYMGHEAVAVLDGGWQAWRAAGLPVRGGVERNQQALFTGAPRKQWLVQLADVTNVQLLIDSRDPARYRGENETLDPKAGHIPGAVNYHYRLNRGSDGLYLSPEQLRQHFERLLDQTPASEAVFYCGSGVSACANLLALAHAGLPPARLYAGSWSEWSRTPGLPVETNE
jgi:thiosulfate/3-mercaptopyruvate sulfurtransferase